MKTIKERAKEAVIDPPPLILTKCFRSDWDIYLCWKDVDLLQVL